MGQYSENDMKHIYEKTKELLAIIADLEEKFSGRKFTLDGHLLGSIGEVMAAYHYGIELFPPSAETHDGRTPDGRNVQVKITQGKGFVFRKEPDYLIALHLDKHTGEVTEVYNGSGNGLFSGVEKDNHGNRVSLNQLLGLDSAVTEYERIPAMHEIPKYKKSAVIQNNEKISVGKSASGKTLVKGYVNKNSQMNCGSTGEPGNLEGQTFYWMQCLHCGHEYKANGCDVWLRKCPNCM